MIFFGLGEFGGLLHGIIQATDLVDELDFDGIGGEPYTALSDGVNLCRLHTTTFRDDVEEILVTTVDVNLHVLHNLVGVLAKNQVCLIVRILIGGHTVEGHTELILYQSAEVGYQSEDADAASDGRRLSNDIVGR